MASWGFWELTRRELAASAKERGTYKPIEITYAVGSLEYAAQQAELAIQEELDAPARAAELAAEAAHWAAIEAARPVVPLVWKIDGIYQPGCAEHTAQQAALAAAKAVAGQGSA